jgi:tol-pal system protein YbgF
MLARLRLVLLSAFLIAVPGASHAVGQSEVLATPAASDALGKMLRERIRFNLMFSFPDPPILNFPAQFALTILPNGMIEDLRLQQPSGLAGFDEAVNRAILRALPFPVDAIGAAPAKVVVASYPLDDLRKAGAADREPARIAWQDAMTLMRAGNYAAAERAYTQFLRDFPQSPFVPYVHYWRGTAYFAQRKDAQALAEQQALVDAFPRSPILPEALTNMAAASIDLHDWQGARDIYQRIVRDFPLSEAATFAQKRLRKMSAATIPAK